MPTFSVGDRATQVSQTGTAEALVRNTGASAVYLDVASAVSPFSYGIELQPFDSVNWPTGSDLWAVTGPGNVSSLSVLYGATGVSLGSVAAVVTGDVTATIDGPVDAQITGPVTVNGTVDVGNVVQTEVNNTVSTSVTNTVATTVTGTVDTLITAPVEIDGTVDVAGNVGISGPVTVSGSVAITSGTIDADITGPVTIASGTVNVGGIAEAVSIEGGGEQLYSNTVNVAGSGTQQITVSIPPGSPTYYCMKVYVEIANSPAASVRSVVVRDLFGNTCVMAKQATGDSLIGIPYIHEFTVPMQSSTYDLFLDNLAGTTSQVFVQISGVNVSSPTPTTNMSRLFRNATPVSFTPGTTGTDPTLQAWLPPSFQPYTVILRCNSTSGVLNTMQLSYLDFAGSADQVTQRAWNAPGYPDPNGTAPAWSLQGPLTRYIPISGNGRASRINIPPVSTNNGSIQLNIGSAPG